MATSSALLSLLALFLANMPVAFAIAFATLLYFLNQQGLPVNLIFQRMISGSESFPLLAVPFFIMAGSVMNYSGIGTRIMDLAEVMTGHMRGGLAQVNVVASTLFGGLCGSANADAAWEAKFLVPQMTARGYSLPFAAAVTATSALISPIIPPGIGLIIYGFLADVSVGKLFIAGIIPGLLMTVAMMFVVDRIAKQRNYAPTRQKPPTLRELLISLRDASWALLLPIAIIGGIRFGVFTPTEAGAMSVVYSLIVGAVVYRELKWQHIGPIIQESLTATAAVMLIIAAASAFGWVITYEELPQLVTGLLLSLSDNPWVVLAILNIALLIAGMFMEGTAIMIIVVPLLMPTVLSLGIDPVHFGIVLVVNLTIGAVTPPLGTVMYTTCAITRCSVSDFTRENLPLLASVIFCLILLTYIPELSLFLPRLLMS